MRIIISPAKKMRVERDIFACRDMPLYLKKTGILLEYLQGLDYETCKAIWKCNDRIARDNMQRLARMKPELADTPAILAYEGIQYQYMAPTVLEEKALEYLQEHLRILSGFYGILRPFDGVAPYRLEMQARLKGKDMDSLYAFWGDIPGKELFKDNDLVLDLASKEYSKCVTDYHRKHPECGRIVTCVFGELHDGRVVEKGTYAKMARGQMVRFLAETEARSPEDVKKFAPRGGAWGGKAIPGYAYAPEHSEEDRLVFLRKD